MFQWIDNTKAIYHLPKGRNFKDLKRDNVALTRTDLRNRLEFQSLMSHNMKIWG